MQNKKIVLTMEYADGTTGKREILSIFKADNGREYAALLPLNEDDTIESGANIELVRVKKYQNENFEDDYFIEIIGSDVELSTAIEAFKTLGFVNTLENDGALSIDNIEPNDDSDELLTLKFKNSEGKLEDWKVVDVFECNENKYIALIPYEDSEDDYGNIKINLMRLELFIQGGVEGCEVSAIPTNKEYEEVVRIFEQRVNESNSN